MDPISTTTTYMPPFDLFYLIVADERRQTKPMLIASCIISVCAAVTNGFSLSYFLRSGRGGVGNKLLVLLNSLDLLYCISMTISLGLHFDALGRSHDSFIHSQAIYLKSNAITYVFEEGTGFATLLLSITRCISVYNPFYRMKTRALVLSSLVFFSYLLVKNAAFIACFAEDSGCVTWTEDTFRLQIGVEMMLIIGVVLVANGVAMSKLHSGPRDLGQERETSNRRVTLTVFILSLVFCCLNTFKYTVVFAVLCHHNFPFELMDNLAQYIAIPLNSAINPVIYTVRTRAMRHYASNLVMCTAPDDQRADEVQEGVVTRHTSNVTRISAVQLSGKDPRYSRSIAPLQRISRTSGELMTS